MLEAGDFNMLFPLSGRFSSTWLPSLPKSYYLPGLSDATISGNPSLILLPLRPVQFFQPWGFWSSLSIFWFLMSFGHTACHRAPQAYGSDASGFRINFFNPHFSGIACKNHGMRHVEILWASANWKAVIPLSPFPEGRVAKFQRRGIRIENLFHHFLAIGSWACRLTPHYLLIFLICTAGIIMNPTA